ncbi:MAG TPA: YciI family protein [Amycolatopsis sp.]|nr:YciI family protein [Amycolatopsis sp.]
MKYLLLICGESYEAPEGSDDDSVEKTIAWAEDLDKRGIRLVGNRLADAATTLRARDGEVLVSDGPFTETKEQILGFDLLECADLDEAIEAASKHPWLPHGSIEIRPVWPV